VAKVSMKEIFGEPKLRKDGTPGKIIELPPLDSLQAPPLTRPDWPPDLPRSPQISPDLPRSPHMS